MSETFSSRLRNARGKRPQSEVCAAIGVKQGTYSTWELGKYEPSFEVLVRIATYLEVTTDYLLGMPEKMKEESDALRKLERTEKILASVKSLIETLDV